MNEIDAAAAIESYVRAAPYTISDPLSEVEGMASPLKLRLLNSLYSHCNSYLEIGTYKGKSLIGAMLYNTKKDRVTCIDNFSEFGGNLETLLENLNKFNFKNDVEVFDGDFNNIVPKLVRDDHRKYDLYFYDGAHDYGSQFKGIRLVEPLLADEAVVVVDDWRHAPDSLSFAEKGTIDAIAASKRSWVPLLTIPARYNGDMEWGWNGVTVFYTFV